MTPPSGPDWTTAEPTGEKAKPEGPNGEKYTDDPTGELYKIKIGKSEFKVWRPDNGKLYWCHGFTFGGGTAKKGPFSPFGLDIPSILQALGYVKVCCAKAKKGDIVVFWNGEKFDQVAHSGVLESVQVNGDGSFSNGSTMMNKPGEGDVEESPVAQGEIYFKSKYDCWTKRFKTAEDAKKECKDSKPGKKEKG